MSEPKMQTERAAKVMAVPAIVLLGLLLFVGALPADRVLSLKDAGHLFLALKTRTAEAFQAGQLPLWDESIGCGSPLLADPVAQVFYPGNVLFLLASASQSLKYFALLHLMLTALAFMVLAREFGVLNPGALVGGLVLMGSGAVVSFHYNPTWTAGLPCLLVSMAYSRRLIYGRGSWGSAAVLSGSLFLMHLAGAFELILAFAVYAAAELIAAILTRPSDQAGRKSYRPPLRGALFLTLSGALAAGLAACQLLPTFEMLSFSSRSIGVPSLHAAIWSLHPGRWLELVAPQLFGDPGEDTFWIALLRTSPFANQPLLSGIYLGVPALALAMAGLSALPRRERWILAGMTLVTAVLSLGDQTPVFDLARQFVPGMGLFRYPAKIFLLSMISITLLAGAGANALLEGKARIHRIVLISSLGLGVLLLGCSLLGLVFQDAVSQWISQGIVRENLGLDEVEVLQRAMAALFRGFGVALIFAAFVSRIRRISGRLGLVLLLVLLVLDLGLANRRLIVTTPEKAYFTLPESLPPPERLHESSGIKRIAQNPSGAAVLIYRPHRLSLLGYRCADSYGSLKLANNVMFAAALGAWPDRSLQFRSVRFVVEPPNGHEDFQIRELKDTLPRALVVSRAALAINDEVAARLLGSADFDPRRDIVFSDDLSEALLLWADSRSTSAPVTRVRMLADKATEVHLEIESPAAAYLLLNDTWYPGWQATVNDKTVPILRANLMFRAVQIPAGSCKVKFVYRPQSVRAGLQVSGLSLILLAWMVSLSYRSRKGVRGGRD